MIFFCILGIGPIFGFIFALCQYISIGRLTPILLAGLPGRPNDVTCLDHTQPQQGAPGTTTKLSSS